MKGRTRVACAMLMAGLMTLASSNVAAGQAAAPPAKKDAAAKPKPAATANAARLTDAQIVQLAKSSGMTTPSVRMTLAFTESFALFLRAEHMEHSLTTDDGIVVGTAFVF